MTTSPFDDIPDIYEKVSAEVVGRRDQLRSVLAVLAAGRNLLLEGPPGTGKSTVLRAVTRHWGTPFLMVEGNAEMTPQKMIGYHDPAAVLSHGYRVEDFVPGPLAEALRCGGVLYIEEFNRLPEDTLNTLLTAMAEGELHIPRYGLLSAAASFRVVAAMNPFDNIGTGRISSSVYDRFCRLAVGYQSEEEEQRIVRERAGLASAEMIALGVRIARDTRTHPLIRSGCSVRGAIDFVLVEHGLRTTADGAESSLDHLITAANLALSSKIVPDEAHGAQAEDLIRELTERATRVLRIAAAPEGHA